MNILLIDDDPDSLKYYQHYLNKTKYPEYNLFLAPDGETGLEIIKKHSIRTVVTDLVMPGISGIDVLQQAKAFDASIEVIVITSLGSIESAVEAMRLGARDYLTKPVYATVLIEKLANIRELFERRAEAEDYREAKETMEADAHQMVEEMETKLTLCIELIKEISILATAEGEDRERLKQIEAHVRSFYENVYEDVF